MARFDRQWESLTPVPRRDGDATEWTRQELAERVVAQASVSRGADPVMIDGHLCTPMTAAGQIVGLLAVPESVAPMTEGGRRVLVAASTLLGISLRNAELFREVREHSLRDGLTGCYNRMHALEVIGSELRRARRTHAPLSLIMFDLDHFKAINDRFGHLTGDAVLMAVGSRMREVLRGSDLKCRFGGEEFLVLLPETPLEGARRVADNLRRELAELQVRWNNQTLAVTASFGVTTALPAEVDVEEFIGRADRALYKAKDQGRNCVHIGVATAVA